MNVGQVTRVVMVIAIVSLAGWATLAAVFGATKDTISGHIRDYCAQYPILAVAAGVLIGHWFWPMGPAVPRDTGTLEFFRATLGRIGAFFGGS